MYSITCDIDRLVVQINILTIYKYNICVELTTDNTTRAGTNYKELYDSKCDPMTLTNNILYTAAFKFL